MKRFDLKRAFGGGGNGVNPSGKVAFTLAEILITLGVIGVVVALTLPTLINQYRGYVLEQQFKKSYSSLSQIVLNIKKDSGIENLKSTFVISTNGSYDESAVKSYYSEFLNHITYIEKLEKPYYVTNYSGTETSNVDMGGDLPKPLYILQDGSSIGTLINNGCIRFWVDTNGPYKKPNRYGFDIFEFRLTNSTDILKPVKAYKNDYTDEELANMPYPYFAGEPCSKANKQQLNGVGCSYYAMNNINPDDEMKKYWDSLPW